MTITTPGDEPVIPELPMLEDAPPEVFGVFFDAFARPAPGYTEIANEGGIRWHARTEALGERCTCTDAGGMVEVRGGRCTYCRKPYAG